MQQKKLGDILYVFDITPYEITEDTDATVIKVQEECYAGFVELNESLADKIVKYNYHVITSTEQEWAPYVEVEDDEPEVTAYTFAITGEGIDGKLSVYFDDVEQDSTSGYEWTDVAPDTVIGIIPTDEPGYYSINDNGINQPITWDNDNNCWTVEMPDSDLTVTIDYSGNGGDGESGASGESQ